MGLLGRKVVVGSSMSRALERLSEDEQRAVRKLWRIEKALVKEDRERKLSLKRCCRV